MAPGNVNAWELKGIFRDLSLGRVTAGEVLRSLARSRGASSSVAVEEAQPGSEPAPYDEAALREAMAELDGLIGLSSVKELVREVQAFVMVQRLRASMGLAADPTVLHMIFKGNPGTGKTTVARIMGKMFKAMGVLSKGHLVEVERADLVGEYIGHTAHKAREQVKRAIGGILFIDEAYSLARGGEKDFGKEAIDTLVKQMEDYRDQVILILAGYRNEMDEFIKTNPGLRSRFPIHIDFPDYSVDELTEIAKRMTEVRQYALTREAERTLARIIRRAVLLEDGASGNARFVRNLVERAIRRQAVRLAKQPSPTRQQLMLLTDADFEEAARG